jgi:hypothetical protein
MKWKSPFLYFESAFERWLCDFIPQTLLVQGVICAARSKPQRGNGNRVHSLVESKGVLAEEFSYLAYNTDFSCVCWISLV